MSADSFIPSCVFSCKRLSARASDCFDCYPQGGGKKISTRTDIWSLGLVLSEACTGCYPFADETEAAISRFLGGADPGASELVPLLNLPDDTPGMPRHL